MKRVTIAVQSRGRRSMAWPSPSTSNRHTRSGRAGPHRKSVGEPRIGDPVAIAVCDQHRSPGYLVHRLVLGGPRCQRADRHHRRVIGDPQRRTPTHRVSEQGHRDGRALLAKVVERPPRIRQRVQLGFVPAAVAVEQQPNRKALRAAAPVQRRGERDHPQVGTPPPPSRLDAGGLASVQDQDDRTNRAGVHRPEVVDRGSSGCHQGRPFGGGRQFSAIAEYAAQDALRIDLAGAP